MIMLLHPPAANQFKFKIKGTLELYMCPVNCSIDKMDDFSMGVCNQINDNQIGEKAVFKDGMSVSDLQTELATFQPYTKYKEWTIGFCFHSDWLWGYFSNYYNLSKHSDDEFFKDIPRDRMEGYNQSQIFYREDKLLHPNMRRNCDNQRTKLGQKCVASSPICHYQTPKDMTKLSQATRQTVRGKNMSG